MSVDLVERDAWRAAAQIETTAWDVAGHLETEEEMAAYLDAVLEDGDPVRSPFRSSSCHLSRSPLKSGTPCNDP